MNLSRMFTAPRHQEYILERIDSSLQRQVAAARSHFHSRPELADSFEAALYEEAVAYLQAATAEQWRTGQFGGVDGLLMQRVAARPDAGQWK